MKITSYSGNKKILDTGIRIIQKDEDLLLEIDTEEGLTFNVRFILETGRKEKGFDLETREIDGKKELCVIKCGDPGQLGTGPSDLLEIGHIGEEKLYLYCIIYKMFQGQFFKIEYALYKE